MEIKLIRTILEFYVIKVFLGESKGNRKILNSIRVKWGEQNEVFEEIPAISFY